MASTIIYCIDNNACDPPLPPNALYSRYKNLSKGVFDKFQGIYDKTQLEEMKQRNLECAKSRIEFQQSYIDPSNHDQGHKKIIDTAVQKAVACHVASQPIEAIKKWYGGMRFVYNTLINHYNLCKCALPFDTCKQMIVDEMVWYNHDLKTIVAELPPYLLDGAIQYAVKMTRLYQDHYEGVTLGFLTKKQASPRVFWCLCGFDDDPFVKNLYLSIGNLK